ncbi:DUF4411 family protein [Prevotella sp. HJM029]|uniref:DUF4411 family protein n=1 Tax=Prevotella sp. HJM029 TaxID=1433844 RepID=UPI00048DA9F9|nr:DUF4411 family protein [Prevotella sp. HJM029]
MRTIVDTSSLVRMAQSYQPFDSTETLESFLKNEMENGSLVLLDKVVGEIRNIDKGIAYETFKCLQDKKYVCSTTGLVPSPRFYNMLDNSFVDRAYKKIKLQGDEDAYQNEREAYVRGTDCTIIVYAMQEKKTLEPVQILTEESIYQNDGKLFRKIPFICKTLDIPTVNVVQYFKQHKDELTVEIKSVE